MNLLPKAKGEFKQANYWENFFKKRGNKSFDWYGEYTELCGLLHKYIKTKDNTLVIGCGNSTLSATLYDVGYRNITNIDTSSIVIKQMQNLHKNVRPDLIFEQKDALNTEYPNEKFSCVLDKGTLDALMPDDDESTKLNIDKLFKEIDRILRVGGRYICISLLQPHIMNYLVDIFSNKYGWPIRVCRCNIQQNSNESGGPKMPVFFIVCTKFKPMNNMPKIVEMSLLDEHVERTTIDNLIKQIEELQHAALVQWQIRSKRHLADENDDSLNLQLYRAGDKTPRYSIHIVDKPITNKKTKTAYKFAAFVVPQGRETEYLFASAEGHKQLLNSASADRLAIITLQRGHKFNDIDSVKEEISSSIVQLAPPDLPENTQIPFLSTGDDAGRREVIYEGHSDFSGDFVVEDVESDGQELRKLVFLGNRGVVQSEALLDDGDDNKKIIDLTHLSCDHHRLMVLSLSSKDNPNGLVIGLGGGGLCSYMHHCFPSCTVTAVEIDPVMVEVAEKYFGLIQDNRLMINIGDGLKYIFDASAQGKLYNAVLFDVDNKDTSLGMSCPPKEFIQKEILEKVKSILRHDGLFVLNLVCRDPTLHKIVLQTLKEIFLTVLLIPLEGEVNEVVFCSSFKTGEEMKNWIHNAAVTSNLLNKKAKAKDELVDVRAIMNNLKLSPE